MTRTPIANERPPGAPRPVPILQPREDYSEEELRILADAAAREMQDATLDYDPYD